MNAMIQRLLLNDKQLYLTLNAASKSSAFAHIMHGVTHLGATTTAIFAAILALYLEYTYQIPIGMEMLLTLIISQMIVQTIKRLVNRPRPYKSLSIANVLKPPTCAYSFPSGHTACAFTIALSYASGMPSLFLPLMIIAFIVGMSRIILGYHYPTDVLIGMLIASLSHIWALMLI
jgi:undecaprenyl-diphosphatase